MALLSSACATSLTRAQLADVPPGRALRVHYRCAKDVCVAAGKLAHQDEDALTITDSTRETFIAKRDLLEAEIEDGKQAEAVGGVFALIGVVVSSSQEPSSGSAS